MGAGARTVRCAALALVAAGAFACAGARGPATGPKVPSSAAELAVAAYVYSYPLVLFDRLRQDQVEVLGAHNQLVARTTTSTPFSHAPGAPDADTVSAVAFLDLRMGPLVLAVPDGGDRFTRIELLDAYNNVFASLGQRTQGNGARQFVIVGPDSSGQASGATTVKAPTSHVLLHGQLAAEGERDVSAAAALVKQWSLTPLSEFSRGGRRLAVELPRGVAASDSPVARVEALDAGKYFEQAAQLMQIDRPPPADAPLVKKFPTVGLDWQSGRFAPSKMKSSASAREQALAQIRGAQPALREQGGWTFAPATGSFGVDYVSRAAAARVAIGGKLAEDELEATTRVDASGQRLQGAHRYAVRFAKRPPAKAFWSLTLVDDEGRLVDNVLNRYALRGDRLRKDGDGATVYVQHAPPPDEKRANWLPAPKGPFQLLLRLYAPDGDAVNGSWTPPAVQRVD
jgi:hypothetical protein